MESAEVLPVLSCLCRLRVSRSFSACLLGHGMGGLHGQDTAVLGLLASISAISSTVHSSAVTTMGLNS
jgi:hypothetical protein